MAAQGRVEGVVRPTSCSYSVSNILPTDRCLLWCKFCAETKTNVFNCNDEVFELTVVMKQPEEEMLRLCAVCFSSHRRLLSHVV